MILRQQLVVLRRKSPKRVRLWNRDRLLMVWLYRLYPTLLDAIIIVQPETVIRWHRRGFRAYWRWKSSRGGGRPRINRDVRALIRQMNRENPLWGAPRIHGELLMLGIEVAESTVGRYMVRRRRPERYRRWCSASIKCRWRERRSPRSLQVLQKHDWKRPHERTREQFLRRHSDLGPRAPCFRSGYEPRTAAVDFDSETETKARRLTLFFSLVVSAPRVRRRAPNSPRPSASGRNAAPPLPPSAGPIFEQNPGAGPSRDQTTGEGQAKLSRVPSSRANDCGIRGYAHDPEGAGAVGQRP